MIYESRLPSGSIHANDNGSFTVRLTYYDSTGRRKDIKRRAKTKSQAERVLLALKTELAKVGRIEKRPKRRYKPDLPKTISDGGALTIGRVLESGMTDVTFRELAAWYNKTVAVPPKRDGSGRRVKGTGIVDYHSNRKFMEQAAQFFGEMPIRKIEHSDMVAYRDALLSTPKARGGGVRTIASVNRHMSVIRRALVLAMDGEHGWLDAIRIKWGDIIRASEETERDRIITVAEENRLLVACEQVRNGDVLRGFVLTILDCGLRPGEVRSLRWKDVDLVEARMTVQPRTTKTQKGRELSLSKRLVEELKARYLKLASKKAPAGEDLLFGIKSNVQTSWDSARAVAQLEDVHMHDLRHTCATRWASDGMASDAIGRLLGHVKKSEVTYRYVSLSDQIRTRQKEIADRYEQLRQEDREKKPVPADAELELIQRAIRGR